MTSPDAESLIYDWNEVARRGRVIPKGVEFFDETLRDGLQNPSVKDPTVEEKLEILRLSAKLGVHELNVGLPGSSKRAFEDCLRLCHEVTSERLPIRVAAAGRTIASDIAPIIELSQRAGLPVEIYAFVGSSPIRGFTEGWDAEHVRRLSAEAIDLGVRHGLPVCFVTEDTTRSRPEALSELFRLAIDHGATGLCLCDTVGHATPDGVRNLIEFTRSVVAGMGAKVRIDWHGHNDRGLALVNAIYALEVGAQRVHGTALGIGERVGNAPLELILLNLKLLGLLEDQDLSELLNYCTAVARAVGWDVPINYPLVGDDAFRTATGVHAAAIIKAKAKGDEWLADRIYSGVPAGMFGRRQEICIGYMSGASNVGYWLRERGLEPEPTLVRRILEHAKRESHILTDAEVYAVIAAPAAP